MGEIYDHSDNELNILDALNSDCWRELLSYVPVEDVIRSERVSRRWRDRVLEYLQGIRLSVEYVRPCIINILSWDRHPNSRQLTLDQEESSPETRGCYFNSLVQKFGPAIVFIGTDRFEETDIEMVVWCCPNLEILLLCNIEHYLPLEQLKCCQHLKRISFHTCTIPDEYICHLLNSVPIDDLVINNASYVSGMFLAEPKSTKLKSLTLSACYLLMTDFFRTAIDLDGLTRLDLTLNSVEVYRNVHLLLNNTPNLEYLRLISFDKKTNVGTEFVDSVSSLSKLRYFYARYINNANEGWLEDVAIGCRDLKSLDVGNCTGVTASSVLSLCRAAGPLLTELGVAWNTQLTDDHVAACVTLCPNLTSLDIQGCVQVTAQLVTDILSMGARAEPLRVRLRRTKVPQDIQTEYPSLILDFGY